MTCSEILKSQGQAYPRTCQECGLGPCRHPSYAKPQLTMTEADKQSLDLQATHLIGIGDAKLAVMRVMRSILRGEIKDDGVAALTVVLGILQEREAEIARQAPLSLTL